MLVNATNKNQELSSDDIANECGLARGTVAHHLNRLRDAGLVTTQNTRYQITGNSIHDALQKIQGEIQNMFNLMDAVAKDIDRKLR